MGTKKRKIARTEPDTAIDNEPELDLAPTKSSKKSKVAVEEPVKAPGKEKPKPKRLFEVDVTATRRGYQALRLREPGDRFIMRVEDPDNLPTWVVHTDKYVKPDPDAPEVTGPSRAVKQLLGGDDEDILQ